MLLAAKLLHVPQSEFQKSFEIAIQLGAILAALTLYWRSLLCNRAILARVVVAFLPTAVIGFFLHNFVKTVLLDDSSVVLWSLFLGGIALIAFEGWHRERRGAVESLGEISYPTAFVIGLCQSVAIIPGVSRSAATIVGGLMMGLKRRTIVDFSFLLAIPTMSAATGWDLLKTGAQFSASEFGLLALGFGMSFVVALLAITWLLQFIRQHSFAVFGWYRIVVAMAFWLFA